MNLLWLAEGAGASGVTTGEQQKVLFHLFGLQVTSVVTTEWAIMALVILFFFVATRRLDRVPKSKLQLLVESAVESLYGFVKGQMGEERAREFVPLIGSFFIFILVSNYSGLIPGAGHVTGFAAPTSHWSVTLGLALVVFAATQYYGIKKQGFDYIKHMFQPYIIAPLIFVMNVLDHIVRPMSLSLRLYANIFGGETVVVALLVAIPYFLPITTLLLELIFGFIQAFIFTALTTVYLTEATGAEEE